MTNDMSQFFGVCCIGIALVAITGMYYLLVTFNLIRAIIGLELLTKAVTLFIILAGYVTGRTGLAQAIAITIIVVEVVVIAVAVGVVLCVFKYNKNINVKWLQNLKG
jgi:multisubunit Na+/H+ antiporter MnhC subunit